METLGPLLRKSRERKGIRATDLAYRIGKDPSYLSKLERGLLKEIPPPETLRAISEALGIPERGLLEAIGYRVGEEAAAEIPFGSERALLATLVPALDEREARILRRAGEILIEERDARTVAEAERYALGAAASSAPPPRAPSR